MRFLQGRTTLRKTPLTKKVAGIPEKIVIVLLFLASSFAVFITAAIVYTLLKGSIEFFNYDEVNLWDFLTGTEWVPSGTHPRFGILPLVTGTLLVTGGTIILAGPIGVGAALFLSEYAPFKLRSVMKPVIELLAGIPSIVYGFFALYTIGPYIRQLFPEADYFNVLQGVVVMTFMVLPIIVSISDDTLKAVPNHLREASLAMGATKWETSLKVVIPAASSGISASILLGIARAIGETMVVALAVGSISSLHFNPLQEAMPLTAYIAQTATGDIPPGSAGADAGYAVGMVLFVLVFIINLIAGQIVIQIKKGGMAKKEPSKLRKFVMAKIRPNYSPPEESGSLEEKTVIRKIDRSKKLIKEKNQDLRLKFRHIKGYTGVGITASSLVIAFIFLVFLLIRTFKDGYGVINIDFLTAEPGWRISELSIMPAIAGSVFLMLLTLVFAVPIGVATAIFFNEIARDTFYTRFIRRMIQNLAGVPSIVFGLVGLAIFVRMFDFQRSLLAGSLTLGLMILPIIVVSSEEALKSVPMSFREAARGMGATRWQTVKDHVLPNAIPGIITGSILAMSRAIGETAPILFIGATFAKVAPSGIMDDFVALPLTIFYWARVGGDYTEFAQGTILVLLVILLSMNAIAIFIRYRSQKRRDW